jgi:hypothetical protein
MKRKPSSTSIDVNGETCRGFYGLMRRWLAVFDERRRTRRRCRDCINMRSQRRAGGCYVVVPRFACGGCSEMHDAERELRDYFRAEAEAQGGAL